MSDLPVYSKMEVQKLADDRLIIVTNNHQKTKKEIVQELFSDLVGVEISVTDAAKKYKLHRNTILKWARQGYVMVLQPGYKRLLDEADVAYCHYVYQQRKEMGITKGTPLLREDDSPYTALKHPSIARLRKNNS